MSNHVDHLEFGIPEIPVLALARGPTGNGSELGIWVAAVVIFVLVSVAVYYSLRSPKVVEGCGHVVVSLSITLLGSTGEMRGGILLAVAVLTIGVITATVTYSALRSRRMFGRGGSLVIAICGGILAAIELFGAPGRTARSNPGHHVTQSDDSLLHAIAIPWAALGMAVIATCVFVLVLRVSRMPALRKICRCVRTGFVSLRRPISKKSDSGKSKVSMKVRRRSDGRIEKHDPSLKWIDDSSVDESR